MKKRFGAIALALVISGCYSPHSTTTPTTVDKVISVQQALTSTDDAYVTLEGRILNKAGDESYWFSDNTGKIRVEIDDDVWRGQSVSSTNNRVRLSGNIDKDHSKIEVDVKTLTVLQR